MSARQFSEFLDGRSSVGPVQVLEGQYGRPSRRQLLDDAPTDAKVAVGALPG